MHQLLRQGQHPGVARAADPEQRAKFCAATGCRPHTGAGQTRMHRARPAEPTGMLGARQ
ncbi:hypothetical protein LP420_21985 [Massilia sp. B-10]|nr:hypothetical protein LP420_21985 [Massilia sp. B-10]